MKNGTNTPLYNSMRKYGEDNFTFSIMIHNIPIKDLNYYEQLWIRKLNTKSPNGYNLTFGGDGTRGFIPWNKGIKRPDISEFMKNYNNNPEIKEKMRQRVLGNKNPMYGRHEKHPERSELFLGEKNPFYKRHHTEKTKMKIKENVKNRKANKIVLMIDLKTNEILKEFESIHEATRYLKENTKWIKADHSFISRCARGNHESAYGYKWKFK